MLDWDGPGRGWAVGQLPQPWRRLAERLEEYHGHPARGWFVGVGNGVFEDDPAVRGLPAPHWVYRCRRAGRVADVGEVSGGWLVRPWQRTRGGEPNALVRVSSLPEALDVLQRQPRSWWRFGGEPSTAL
jgi:hypothetical protein